MAPFNKATHYGINTEPNLVNIVIHNLLLFCFSDKPGMFDLKGKAKFEAWSGKKGLSKEDAQKAYIAKVDSLVASIGLQ
ncbi:acyl-CoA-binding protein homolog [Vanessa atalanta]|uniref:acyl-CoA-binding protein homolog n=1 Tax=Vanessa atalanta TaxID=42275 RepID=UPI001FCD2C54|nr:acyl-CoA-binding protein homolog [Vanessa atalanta]